MADRTVKVTLKGDISDFNRAMLSGAATAKAFHKELDTGTDRATNLVQSVLAIGPALVPVAATGVPILAGLTNQLAFAAAGAGVTALAFSGVGDALKAVNDYQLEPTTANFEKMSEALNKLGPDGREFVMYLQSIRPELQKLQDAAQAGLLPGAETGLRELMELMPQAESIVSTVATALGDLLAEGGDNLNDARWREFFDFLDAEARPTLLAMGRTLGNFAEGFANLWMAFDPLSDDFSASFLEMSRDFSAWTAGLDDTEGFKDFLEYVERVGPKTWDALGAIGNGLLQVVEAAAPVGEAALPAIEALADVIAFIADSPVGPVLIGAAAGISAISRAVTLFNVAQGSAIGTLLGGTRYGGTLKDLKDLPGALLSYDGAAARAQASVGTLARDTTRLGSSMRGAAKVAGGAGGLAFVMSDLDDSLGLSNTAMLALAGTAFGPWGAAVGAGIGLARDFAAANDGVWQAIERADAALSDPSASYEQQAAAVEAANEAFKAYKADLEDIGLIDFNAFKNGVEGLFGRSDEEEAAAALKSRNDALADAAAAAQQAKFEEAGFGDAMSGTSQAVRDQNEALLDNINRLNARRDAILENRAAERDLEAAIDDAAEAVKENGKNTDIGTEGGRANQEALDGIAAAWNRVDEATQRIPGKYERTRAAFIKTAVAMGYGRGQAEKMAAAFLDIPTKTETTMSAKDRATSIIASIQAARDRLKDKSVTMTVRRREIIERASLSDRGNEARAPRKADGGYITGPGGPRDDAIPAFLSNGEYVINAAATAAHRPLLDAINAKRFADGGPVAAEQLRPLVNPSRYLAAPLTAQKLDLTGARLRLESGALSLRGNDAYVEGVATLVMASGSNFDSKDHRAGRRKP